MEQVQTIAPAAEAEGGALTLDFTQQVNGAFKNYHSILALSRSPLANSALVAPALVRDAVSPTADERGHALRLLLRWAVSLLAPEAERHPLGSERPYDDPTWRDPRWWRYNLLRHRYIEPLHPDEFVEGGRYTETLIGLMGIPGPDAFFDERNRAIREVAAWLQQQLAGGSANEQLRRLALDQALESLRSQPAARTLLDIAATFDDVFPRELLLHIAAEERVPGPAVALAHLTAQRFLLADAHGGDLWLSPVLREDLYRRQPAERLERRHHLAAQFFSASGDALEAAAHWQRAGQWVRGAATLLAAASELVNELEISALRAALLQFRPGQLPADQWRAVQLLLADLALRLGQREEGLTACRRALAAADEPALQAPIFWRMGKLYEQYNQRHALEYYQQAAERFDAADPELVVLLKDRGWLHVLRREWPAAEADLLRALALAHPAARELRADTFDALAHLYLEQRRFAEAHSYARQALALREELGSLPRIADSYNNLGLLYNAMGEHTSAIAVFEEALTTYRKIGNQVRVGGTLLNVGMAHHLAGRRGQAIAAYYESIPLLAAGGRRLAHSRAHYNLAEALAELGEGQEARRHWSLCHQLCLASGFDDEIRDLDELRARFPALLAEEPGAHDAPSPAALGHAPDPDDERALALARQHGQVSPKTLMAAASVSKATATRRLADMVRRGLLAQHGKGRATTYVLPQPPETAPAAAPPDQLERALRANAAQLRERYAVAALGVLDVAREGGAVSLLARFTRAPDAGACLRLADWISTLAQRRVDVLPAACFADVAAIGSVNWLDIARSDG
jgi:tetratricopeptide (TPR) repeat protein